MTRYLVTGGSGFIGSALVRRLLHDGRDVRVLDDGSRGRSSRLDEVRADIEIITGDVCDSNTVSAACRDVDAICHLAAINGTAFFYSMPQRVLEVGIRGMLNVIEGGLRHSIGRILFASSSEVYQTPPRIPTGEEVPLTIPDPHNPRYSYAGSKIASELLLLNQPVSSFKQVVIVRPHNVYGPDMGWEHVIPELAVQARARARSRTGPLRLTIQGSGDETRAFCYIDDAIDGIVLALEQGEHRAIYNVGADVETRIADLAKAIARHFGRDAEIVPGRPASGSTSRRCPDISRLRGLGYEPRVALESGLKRTIAWYDEHADERSGHVAAR